jgi:hypothetical protein
MEFLQSEWWLFAFSILGMIAHILKKNVKGESFVDIKNWFTHNPKSTMLSIIATVSGFVIYMTQFKQITGAGATVIDMAVMFGIGYMSESFFNKYQKEPEIKE